jgi:outer membrane lipoprotein carrier protein
MRVLLKTCAWCLPTLLLLCHLAGAQDRLAELKRLADAVDKHYNSLASLEVNFSESFRGGGLARTESGKMWLKKPGKMRWEYQTPVSKLFMTNGKVAWFYVPGEHQARRASLGSLDDLRSPLRYLLGHTKLEKEFSALNFSNRQPDRAGDFTIAGVPKGMEDRISKVEMEITPDHQICRISIYSLDGSVTEFRFSDERDNVAVANQRFQFVPPPGVEVLEARELEP